LEGNVADAEAVRAMMARAQEKSGLDFLINNAAILRDRSIAKMSPEEWQSVIDVNLSGVFLLLQIWPRNHARWWRHC
jgi:3-oxoacyl-[acyl-carrier protein] reductase